MDIFTGPPHSRGSWNPGVFQLKRSPAPLKMNNPIICIALPACEDTQLWLVDLTQAVPQTELHQLAHWETERAHRFRFERDAHRYRVSHLAMRQQLSNYLGMTPSSLQIETTAHGKPYLAGHPLHFNMSHSGDWALIGLHPHQALGVDIEVEHHIEEMESLAQHNYTPKEFGSLQTANNRAHAFFTCWTRKEACLKALGSGLSIEPRSFEAGVDGDARPVSIPISNGDHCKMKVISLEVRPRLIGAMALVDPQDANRVF